MKYTVESAKEAQLLFRLILSSDDQKIIAAAEKMGLEVPFVRPATLAQDHTPSLEVIKHAIQFFAEKDEKFDVVCLLQPTTPFRRQGLIDEAIEQFTAGDYDSLISVREVPAEFNPHWVFEEINGRLTIATGEKEIISQRQKLPKAYHRDGAIYITKTNVLLEQNSLYGQKIGLIDTTGDPYVNIDTPEDWEKAEGIISMNNEQ